MWCFFRSCLLFTHSSHGIGQVEHGQMVSWVSIGHSMCTGRSIKGRMPERRMLIRKTFKQIDSKGDVEYDGLVVQLSGAFYGLLQAEVSLAKHSNALMARQALQCIAQASA